MILPIVVLWAAAIAHVVFRRPDLSIAWKAAWILAVLVVPTVGVFVYALLGPRSAHGTSPAADAGAGRRAIEEVRELVAARSAGTLSADDFGRRKAEIFGLMEAR